MLKRLIITLMVIIFAVPSLITMAHTHLSTTTPKDQETVESALTEVSLQFEGKPLEGSTFKVVNSKNETISPDQISLIEGKLVGTFAPPLPNDTYVVNWDSISGDGHPLNGTFSFTVQVPEATKEEVIIEENKVDPIPETTKEEINDTKEENSTSSETIDIDNEGSSSFLIIIVIILLVIVLMGTVVFFKAGKKKK